MELNFSDLDTRNPYDTFDYDSYEKQNSQNYWEQNKKKEDFPHFQMTKFKKGKL